MLILTYNNEDTINRNDVIQVIENNKNKSIPEIISEINKIPYIKTNPKKGQWLEYHGLGKLQWICSECSAEELKPENANFCYFCGTDMRESNKIKFKDKYRNGD